MVKYSLLLLLTIVSVDFSLSQTKTDNGLLNKVLGEWISTEQTETYNHIIRKVIRFNKSMAFSVIEFTDEKMTEKVTGTYTFIADTLFMERPNHLPEKLLMNSFSGDSLKLRLETETLIFIRKK